jgi:hypothetical protein
VLGPVGLNGERDEAARALAALPNSADGAVALDDACELLDSLPHLADALAARTPNSAPRL